MGDRVTVDYGILEGSASSLTSIAEAMDRADADRESINGALGHAGLSGAMAEFTGNWDRHRAKLAENIRETCKTFKGTAEAFRQLDTDLGNSVVVGSGSGSPGEQR